MVSQPGRGLPSAFTFSLRQLLVWMGVIALGCVALRSASTGWVAAMLGLALLTMAAAVLFAIYRSGVERAYWIGFATFGWLYLVLLISGWSLQTPVSQDTPLRPYNLVTTQLSNASYHWLYDAAFAKHFAGYSNNPFDAGMGGMGGMSPGAGYGGGMGSGGMAMPGMVQPAPPPPAPGPNEGDFANVAHALWTLLLAACGGWLARWLHATGPKAADSSATVEGSKTAG